MSYYRINTKLTIRDTIIKSNTINNLRLPDERIRKLLSIGAISEISTPPLAMLDNWQDRAKRLLKANIITGLELLNCDVSETAKKLKTSTANIEQWKVDLIDDFLIVKSKKECCRDED